MENTEIDVESLITNEYYEPTEDNRGVICSLAVVNGAVLKGAAYGHELVAEDGKLTTATQNAWMNCQQMARAGVVDLILSHEHYLEQSRQYKIYEDARRGRRLVAITYEDCDPGDAA